jgi:glutamyl-tRNA synthetase
LALFDIDKINRRNAIFDLDKCFWLNGQHILSMGFERFVELAKPFVDKAGIAYGSEAALLAALTIVKPKVKHLSDVPDWIGFLFTEDFAFDPEAVEGRFEGNGNELGTEDRRVGPSCSRCCERSLGRPWPL